MISLELGRKKIASVQRVDYAGDLNVGAKLDQKQGKLCNIQTHTP